MARLTKIIKIFFLMLGLLLLFVPMWQKESGHFPEEKLKGAIVEVPPAEISWENWWSDSLQVQTERHLNDHFGFRTSLVQLNNQLGFWLYKVARAREVVIGKENWLYELGYITAVNGGDYKGKKRNRFIADGLKKIQKMMARSGKLLMVVMAPSKAYVYPEYIPDYLRQEPTDSTNYHDFAQFLPENDILHIDGNKWFRQMRDTASYLLYPKTGIHWSFYGKYLMVDSMVSMIENRIGADLPDLVWKGIEVGDTLHHEDRDIENGMNLLFKIPSPRMAYPKVKIVRENKRMLKNLTISDSYWWTIFGHGIAGLLFDEPEFWYYNREIYGGPKRNEKLVTELDKAKAMADKDLIIILCTEPKLREFSWKFVDDILADSTFEERLYQESMEYTKSRILASKTWIEGVRAQAAERNISVDSMVVLAAAWQLRTQLGRK